MKLPKNLEKYVDEIIDERSDDNGYWVYLNYGYKCSMGASPHIIHEDTVKMCIDYLRYVEPCECKECVRYLKGARA